MLFNSIPFAVFLPIVFLLYWALHKRPLYIQNAFILLASYAFYCWWDWRFLSIIIFGSLADYLIGLYIDKSEEKSRRKLLLAISLFVNFGLLGFFKYYNFFVSSFSELLNSFGLNTDFHTLNLILPIGISFYTFKKLTYTIDIYKGKIKPTRDALAFFSFVAFFPQILSGPIDRASTLLPQFLKKRQFSDPLARDGLRQMLSGFLKKMVIADNLSPIVEEIFSNHNQYDGLSLLLGLLFLAFQLYCDFSGYSDIAIGCAKLFGFDLMQNFAFPYFSRDIAEFWRRWHISLSTWLRDYVYVPLCGTRPSRNKKAVNIVITFTLCGLWHGASWTYILWGFINGIYFLPMTLAKRHPRFIGTAGKGRFFATVKETRAILLTFSLTTFAWIFFRSESIGQSFSYIARMVSHPFMNQNYNQFVPLLLASVLLLFVEWLQRTKMHFLQIENIHVAFRWLIYFSSIIILLVFGAFGSNDFIYSQF